MKKPKDPVVSGAKPNKYYLNKSKKEFKSELDRVAPKIKIEWVKTDSIYRECQSKNGNLFIIKNIEGRFHLYHNWWPNDYMGVYETIPLAKRAAERHINKLYNDIKKGKI